MKLRGSTKIFLGFVVLLAALAGGRQLYAVLSLGGKQFGTLKPRLVNLVGVNTHAGYHIVVANRVAKMVLGGAGEFEQGEHGDPNASDDTKKIVPLRELLDSLSGDAKALSVLVMKLNDVHDEEFPPLAPIWKAEDLRKAMAGDPMLTAKLVRDLNVELDGTPRTVASPLALESGILIDFPVPIVLKPVGAKQPISLMARVLDRYRPRFATIVHQRYAEKEATSAIIAGYYKDEAQKIFDSPMLKENVRASLESRMSAQRAKVMAELPETILNSIQIIVTSDQMTDAELKRLEASNGARSYNLDVELDQEGRDRLWLYSRGKVGTQLLLVLRGIAVAAPRIDHELSERRVTITQLEDEGIAEETLNAIKKGGSGDKKP